MFKIVETPWDCELGTTGLQFPTKQPAAIRPPNAPEVVVGTAADTVDTDGLSLDVCQDGPARHATRRRTDHSADL